MNKIISFFKRKLSTIEKDVKETFKEHPYTVEEAHNVALSGTLETLEHRLKYLIKCTEKSIKAASAYGDLGMMVHFHDEVIRTKMDEFAQYFEKQGFEVEINYSHYYVIILW